MVPNLPVQIPLVSIPTPQPMRATTLGPHLGLSASYPVQPAVALVLGVEYGFEVSLTSIDVGALLTPRGGGAPVSAIRLGTDPVRNTITFDLGVQLRFE